MSTEDGFFVELQKEFLDEASFLLEQCEESYLRLEYPEERVEELGKIFRLAHSMKGAGAAVGFTDLASFAHVVEDCLAILRTYPELVDTDVISLLLRAGDAFKERVQLLKQDPASSWDVSDLKTEFEATISRLNNVRGVPSLEPVPPPVSTQAEEPHAPDTPDVSTNHEPAALASETLPDVQLQAPPHASQPRAAEAAPVARPPGSEGSRENSRAQGSGSSVKVDTERIDTVLDIVGELVVIKSQLMTRLEGFEQNQGLSAVVSLLDKTVRELQDKTLSMRMTPLKSLFLKTQRIVRDLSVKLGKPIDFVMSGEDTEIDRTMVELLGDPLLHIVRNSVDHGVEKPDVRRERNKPERAHISVSAEQLGGRVVLRIRDDGGGISRTKVLQKAIERGLLGLRDPETLTDNDVFRLLFEPGFSTAETVSDVSGRGVGLDVVKSNIEKLKGSIDIESKEGGGTCFSISIPLTTSITDGMLVGIGGNRYIIPVDGIRELIEFDSSLVTVMSSGEEVLSARGGLVPMVPIESFLGLTKSESQVSGRGKEIIVLVEHNGRMIAVKADEILGQIQVVLKSLNESLKDTQGLAGAAILGDGQVALVLDLDGIVRKLTGTIPFERLQNVA